MSLASPRTHLVSQVICLASLVGDGCEWVQIVCVGGIGSLRAASSQICQCVEPEAGQTGCAFENAVTLGGLMACLGHTMWELYLLCLAFSSFLGGSLFTQDIIWSMLMLQTFQESQV